MRSPAIAGPMMRAALSITELRVTALDRFSGPTISSTKVWRMGLSTVATRPRQAAST